MGSSCSVFGTSAKQLGSTESHLPQLLVCTTDVLMATSAVSRLSHYGRQDAEVDRPLAYFPEAMLMFIIIFIH